MEREPVRQSQSDHGNATNGINNTSTTTTTITAPTPTPPRLTPNPTLMDPAHPAQQTAVSSSPPPPPLTPAPSLLSASHHVPKTAAPPAPPPHVPVPAPPPRFTSTGTPILRTYSRPILPCPRGGSPKMSSSASALLALSSSSSLRLAAARSPQLASNASSSSSPTVAGAPPLPFSSAASSSVSPSVTHNDATVPPPKSSAVLTNGNARPISTAHTSTAITPFHTPASPTGRQVTQALGTPGLVRANQMPTPVRQRVSQQALLLGKGLKGSGQDQALLRAQMLILTSAMRPSSSSSTSTSSRPSSSSTPSSSHPASAQLQSLTLRPPPPGTLTIPPSLRLKRPLSSSAPPPLCRGRTPLFPPLRPRPQPGAAATDHCLATPVRPHLSVPPPNLYSPVRAVPLRPRLHSPNGHSGAPPRQSPALQPTTASPPAYTSQAPPVNRHLVALKACPLSQANQSQQAALSMAASPFERSPSAARQLQIIALSSGRQSQQGNGTHAAHASVQSAPSATVEPAGQIQRTLGSRDTPPLPHQPLNPSLPKTISSSSSSPPLSSPPSLLCPPSSPGGPPLGPAPQPQTHGPLVRQGEKQGGEEQRQKGRGGGATGPRCMGGGDEDVVGKDMRMNPRDDQRGAGDKKQEEERKGPVRDAERIVTAPPEQRAQTVTDQQERMEMEVTEEGERQRERTVGGEKEEEEGRESPMDQAENLTVQSLHRHRTPEPDNPEPNSHPATIQNSLPEPKATTPGLVATSSAPEPSAQNQRLAEAQREPIISHEDLCENMSTQSDNQSALSSLSSQSPPSSPFITPSSTHHTLFLPLTSSAHPANLSLPLQQQPNEITQSQEEEAEKLDQSEDESEGNGHWAPRPWPEGRQVLTHLVEGFVIQEGLQPFPVKSNALFVEPAQSATSPQEVNGTNGTAVFPETQRSERSERSEHSADTDEGEGGATDDPGGTSQKDRVVLHCQFCGKRGHAHNFMRSKRFCSTSCARGFNVRLTKRLRALSASARPERPRPPLQRAESVPGKPLLLRLSRDSRDSPQPRDLWTATRREAEGEGREEEEDDEEEEKDGEEVDEEEPAIVVTTKAERRSAAKRTRRTASEPAMNTTVPTTPTTTYPPVPAHWSVEDVTAFIHTLPGCSEVAEAFRVQEIDGQALLLLTEDHLMTSLNIKLGPALKICAHINALKHQ